jgi:hypothetical protein
MTKTKRPQTEYVVSWENARGERKKTKRFAMTVHEAKAMFLKDHMFAKNVTVSRLWKTKSPKISSLFY